MNEPSQHPASQPRLNAARALPADGSAVSHGAVERPAQGAIAGTGQRGEPAEAQAPKGRARKRKKKSPTGEMPLKEHLRELRQRVVKAGIAIVLGAVVGFIVYEDVFNALAAPVAAGTGDDRITTVFFETVGAHFDILLQVSFFVGVILSSPIWLYQLWAFIAPGLKRKEKKYAVAFIAATVPLFLGGVALGWLVLPQAIVFFIGLAPERTDTFLQAEFYIPFVVRMLLAFGLAMILPVVMVGLNMLGLLPGRTILKHWRITVFLIAVVAAIAAPGGDAITMFFLAAPLFLLFGVAIGLCVLGDRRREKKKAASVEDVEAELAAGPRPLDQL